MKEKGYRLNVGLIIADKQGRVLLCKRKGINSWQFPQGGIDLNESPLKAAKRELFEEVGINSKDVKLIKSLEEWLKYDVCLLYTSPSPRDVEESRMASYA